MSERGKKGLIVDASTYEYTSYLTFLIAIMSTSYVQ